MQIFKIYFQVIIQLLVASELSKNLVYHTFNDSDSTNAFNQMLQLIEQENMNVKTVYKHLEDFCEKFTKLKIRFKDETKSISLSYYFYDLK